MLQMPVKGTKGLEITVVTLTIISFFNRLLTKHLIQISTESLIFGHLFAIDDTASIISLTKKHMDFTTFTKINHGFCRKTA